MAFRVNLLALCLSGCVISVLLALYFMVWFDSALLAFLPTVLVPPLACMYAGLQRRDKVMMIAVFATLGWFAGTAFTPHVTMGPRAQIEHRVKSTFAGGDDIVPCAVLGAIFAFGGACFVSSPEDEKIDKINGRTETAPSQSANDEGG